MNLVLEPGLLAEVERPEKIAIDRKITEYAAGYCFDEAAEHVALILKARPAWMKGKWNGIGGHVELGETPAEAQRREFREETGVDVLPHEWRQFGLMTGPGYRVSLFVAYTNDVENIRTVTDEQVFLFQADNLPGNCLPNVLWLCPCARDSRRAPSFTEVSYTT